MMYMDQIVLVYDEYHDQKAISLMNRLQTMKIEVLRCTQYTTAAEREQAMKKTDYFFVLLTDDAPLPRLLVDVAERMVQESRDRDKKLYVIKEYRAALPPDLQGYPILEPEDGTLCAPQGGGIAGMICNLVVNAENKQLLYEKLSALMAIDYRPGIQETLVALCELLCQDLLSRDPWTQGPREEMQEILQIFVKLDKYGTGYGQDQKDMARKMLSAAANAGLLAQRLRDSQDLFCLACGLRIMELDHDIRASCVDTITTGDVDLYDKPMPELYEDLSRRFLMLLQSPGYAQGLDRYYRSDEIPAIMSQANRLLAPEEKTAQTPKTGAAEAPALTETEQKLHAIAEFMSKGYSLFESMSHDKTASDFLRCLKTSFERLKNYCDIIDAKAISAQCIGYIVKIDQQLGRLDDVEDAQDKAGLGLKALLGLRLPQSGQYDVFLSYKHEDEDIVRKVYHFLKSKLLNVFFDKVTLPELSESDYDEAIMKALDHARHFVVIITDLTQLNAYWIQLEMKTFHHEMVEGRKPDANFIMLVTDQVYEQIMGSNKTCLPLRYRSCEIMRISDYKTALPGYMTK